MENNNYEITIKELLKKIIYWLSYIRSKWLLILIACFIGAILGFFYSYYKKPIYTATLTFALEEKYSNSGGLNSIVSSFGLNMGSNDGGAFAGDNIIKLMKSRLLIEKTLLTKVKIDNKEELLVNRFIDHKKITKKSSNKVDLIKIKFNTTNRLNFTREQDSILGLIQSSISKSYLDVSKVDKKMSIINVSVKSTDEVFAKLFCEQLVKNVTNFYIETKVGKSKKNIMLLESRVDSVQNELDVAMFDRASQVDKNFGLIRQSAAVPKLKQELRVQMLSTMYGELVKNLELSKLALLRDEPLIQVIDTPIYPLHKDQVSKLKSIVFGAVLSALLMIIILLSKEFYKIILIKIS